MIHNEASYISLNTAFGHGVIVEYSISITLSAILHLHAVNLDIPTISEPWSGDRQWPSSWVTHIPYFLCVGSITFWRSSPIQITDKCNREAIFCLTMTNNSGGHRKRLPFSEGFGKEAQYRSQFGEEVAQLYCGQAAWSHHTFLFPPKNYVLPSLYSWNANWPEIGKA